MSHQRSANSGETYVKDSGLCGWSCITQVGTIWDYSGESWKKLAQKKRITGTSHTQLLSAAFSAPRSFKCTSSSRNKRTMAKWRQQWCCTQVHMNWSILIMLQTVLELLLVFVLLREQCFYYSGGNLFTYQRPSQLVLGSVMAILTLWTNIVWWDYSEWCYEKTIMESV